MRHRDISGLKALRRLSSVKSEKAIQLLTPAADPGSHCPMHTALGLAGRIPGLSTLVIGMPECVTYSRMVIPGPYGKQGELHWLYLLDGNEVVFGCEKGLAEAIREMDAEGARAILLIVTCIPDLIAEDMDLLVRELEPELRARLLVIPAAHYSCVSYPSGYWRTLAALGRLMEGEGRADGCRTINMMGFFSPRDAAGSELGELLSRLGWSLRFLGPGAALEDFAAAPEAALNVVLSPHFVPLAADMKKRFGLPAVHLYGAYGSGEIGEAYHSIEEHLGVALAGTLDGAREELLRLEREATALIQGVTFAIADGRVDPLPLAAYLTRLGMEPLLLHLEGFGQGDKDWARAIAGSGHDPWICHMANPEGDAAVLAELAPGLCIGRPFRHAAPSGTVFMAGPGASGTAYGYGRSIRLLESLKRAFPII